MKKKVIRILLGCMMVAMVGITGCSKKDTGEQDVIQETTVTPTETPTPTPTPTEEVLKTIGEKDAQSKEMKLTNNTGKDIKGVSVKKMEDTEFVENLLTENDVYTNGEKRYLYIKTEDAEVSSEAAEDEKVITPGYDVQLIFTDDTSMVLHAFPIDDLAEGEICIDSEVAFLKYTSVSTGQAVETKEAELSIKAQEEAEAAAAAAAEAKSSYEDDYDEPDYSDDYYEEPDYSDDYYEEPDYSDDYYEEPDYSDDGGYDDGCLDGGLVY